MARLFLWLAMAGAILSSTVANAQGDAAPVVAVTVKPLHSLVSAVMVGVGKPDLLISGSTRVRDYVPAGGDAQRLASARLVFWVGPMLERNLDRAMAAIKGATEVVAVSEGAGVVLRPTRSAGVWALEDDAPVGSGTLSETDGDLWLDPRNARAIVSTVTARLGAADPLHAGRYTSNAAKLYARLDALDGSIAHQLVPVASDRFLVYRDNYQYLEQRYRISAAGAVLGPTGDTPGPIRMAAVRRQVRLAHARCVFGEPDAPEPLLDAVVDGLGAHAAILDPEGIALKPGPDLYFDLMNALVTSLRTCLQGRG